MPCVSVVIPNWNGAHLLGRCLSALQAQTFRDFQIVVVDDGSTDDSVEYVRTHFPEVQVLRNVSNQGFAAATNRGICETHSPYVATLNNDTEVAPEWLTHLLEVMQSDARVGMCASKMLFVDRPRMINSAGICVDRVGIAWDRYGGSRDDPDERAWAEVFGPCAGAALYRRAMLENIGLFDEDFFAYMEDVDLAWRARAAGWRCLYMPQARVLHHHSATGSEGSPFKSFHLGRNKIWLLLKNYPFGVLWIYVPLVLLYDFLAVAFALIIRRDMHALRGRLAGWLTARRMLAKRRPYDREGRLDIEYLSPIEWPWRVSRRYRHLRG